MGSILVLGGAGYIGSHTVYELIDAGESVVIVDNLLTGFKEAVHPKAKFHEGDIRDRAFMDSVFEKEDIVIKPKQFLGGIHSLQTLKLLLIQHGNGISHIHTVMKLYRRR